MSRRIAAVVLAVAMTASACGGDGDPGGFDADPGPIDPTLAVALNGAADPDAVPAVQRSWLELCVYGSGDTVPEMEAVGQERGLIRVCGCGYLAVVASFRSDARTEADPGADPEAVEQDAYDRYRDFEDEVRNGADLPDHISELFADCIRQEAF